MIGGGAIGAEMAQAFSRFGVQVTLVEVADRILALEEPESSKLVTDVFAREGIQVLVGAQISEVAYADGQFSVSLADQTVHADKLLVAAGGAPTSATSDWTASASTRRARSLDTDEGMRVQDGLWAIGDITGKGAFTHMSMYQAAIATAIRPRRRTVPPADYRAVPRVTFTDPEVGSVGLTEKQARDQGLNVRVGSDRPVGIDAGLDPQERQRGLDQAHRGCRPRRAGRCEAAGPYGGEILSGSGRGRPRRSADRASWPR